MPRDAVIGIDVGTGSARAGVFDLHGHAMGRATRPIRMWRPNAEFAEQSSEDIWRAVVGAAREALAASGNDLAIRGIGFDATCSLVVLDRNRAPLSVDTRGDPERDVIVWMDHRAGEQAERISATGHDVLRYVGGRMSLEMQTPKLLWLKEKLPETWDRAGAFFDLPDYLTWRATGSDTRSLCSTVCKWTYRGRDGCWDEGFFRAIGLGQLADEGFARLGTNVMPLGVPIGQGLSPEAAAELGLSPGIPVSTSIIDAHAGGLGVIGASVGGEESRLSQRLALIGGTSSCHMAVSRDATFVPGVWGPYYSAMLPGLWLNEGGQSATGSLVDHVITSHAAHASVMQGDGGGSIYERLNARLDVLAGDVPAALTSELHVLPYFHGNRSPRADPTLRGAVSGLRLSADADDLARLYLATIQAIAYGTRHIIEAMNAEGYAIDTILACGGGTKNPVFLREHADATGCRIVLPEEPEAVLLGAAILGAVAGAAYADIPSAMAGMSRAGRVIEPASGETARFHQRKYEVFQRMYQDQLAYRSLMAGAMPA